MSRKPNPEASTMVAAGLGALALGVLGYFGYKAMTKPAAEAAAAPPPPAGPLAALPAFDPASTDTEHAYMILVTTAQPVHGVDVGPETPVREYLRGINVTQVVVRGPFSKNDKTLGAIATPTPDLVLAVSMQGNILEGMTKEEAEKMKELLASGKP